MSSAAEKEARSWLAGVLNGHFGATVDDVELDSDRTQLVLRIVNGLGDRLRPVVEEQIKANGWLSPHASDRFARERTHTGIADFCRNFRLAVQDMLDVNPELDPKLVAEGMLIYIRLQEAHYARLAKEAS